MLLLFDINNTIFEAYGNNDGDYEVDDDGVDDGDDDCDDKYFLSGLFRYVVMMSGSPSACFAIARPPRKPANVLTDYAEVLNCSFPNKNRIKQCLKNIDWETFLKENDASWVCCCCCCFVFCCC